MIRTRVLITGGSRGIGAAVARLLGARGFPVVVNYAANKAAADGVVRRIVDAGGQAIAVQGDMGVESDILRLFDAADRAFGALGGLVNNAAITGGFARVEDVRAEAIERVMAVNVTGMILCSREAAAAHVDQAWRSWRGDR